jgi:hypothetical protein
VVKKPEFGPGKRRVDVVDAFIENQGSYDVLVSRPKNLPMEWLNGTLVTTGKILAMRGNLVETNQYVYNVLSWDLSNISRQMELF